MAHATAAALHRDELAAHLLDHAYAFDHLRKLPGRKLALGEHVDHGSTGFIDARADRDHAPHRHELRRVPVLDRDGGAQGGEIDRVDDGAATEVGCLGCRRRLLAAADRHDPDRDRDEKEERKRLGTGGTFLHRKAS
ncbi:MAG: hypothetical protein E6K80_10025 [Candidatus Eisenbacteria bacterium]|uniref:Uncharacterized protein n=1 Tax=Eiseniibacteriota bacterium TaxID=2212470 RepID=A0A538U231_UNCEI|nr:MAG: hypothetical protein E6K80_10025 [Candidatus Eisenbacteria bacterium]